MSGRCGLRFADEIEEMPNTNLRDHGPRAQQHDLFEQEIGQSMALGKRSIWCLVITVVPPTPVLNHVDATGTQQWEKNLKGRLGLLIRVGCIVDNQIELIRKFIPNDMLQNFAIRLGCGKMNEPTFLIGNTLQKRCTARPLMSTADILRGLSNLCSNT